MRNLGPVLTRLMFPDPAPQRGVDPDREWGERAVRKQRSGAASPATATPLALPGRGSAAPGASERPRRLRPRWAARLGALRALRPEAHEGR